MNVNDLDALLIGEPFKAMEAARRIIRENPSDVTPIIALATTKDLPLWTRIAAIWPLGFIDNDRVSLSELQRE